LAELNKFLSDWDKLTILNFSAEAENQTKDLLLVKLFFSPCSKSEKQSLSAINIFRMRVNIYGSGEYNK